MNDTQRDQPARQGRLVAWRNNRQVRVLLLIVIFVSGGLVGSALTTILTPKRRHRRRRSLEYARDRFTQRIADRLDLSAAQTEQVRPIIHERLAELRTLRKEMQPRMEKQAALLREKVSAVLNDQQKDEWERYYAELFDRWFSQPESAGGDRKGRPAAGSQPAGPQ